MNSRILAARIVHDVSLSSWFGGELMGAVGLNGAAAQLSDPRQRSRAANAGWSRFSPLLLSSVAAHLASGVVLVREDKGRLKAQQGFARGSAIKTGLTGAALAGTVYQQVLGQRMARGGDQPVVGATQPGPGTAPEQASAQRQLNVLQFLIPALTGSAWVVHSANGELARPAQQAKGTLSRIGTLAAGQGRTPLLAAGAVAAGSGLLAFSRRGSTATGAPPVPKPVPKPVPPPVPAPTGVRQVDTRPAEPRINVVSETVTQTVPVTHEEPVVKSEPITDANRAQAMAGEPLKEDTYEVTLHAEEPVVHKETVVIDPLNPGQV